jgi:hypothetical protein
MASPAAERAGEGRQTALSLPFKPAFNFVNKIR